MFTLVVAAVVAAVLVVVVVVVYSAFTLHPLVSFRFRPDMTVWLAGLEFLQLLLGLFLFWHTPISHGATLQE